MTDFNKCDNVFLEIYPHKEYVDTIKNYINKNSRKVKFYYNFCKKGRWEVALSKSPLLKLSLVYLYLPTVKEKYNKKGIPEKIFYDTMSDIKIWIDDHKMRTNEIGLYELNWIMYHMNMNIFKLGELQFQKSTYYFNPQYNKNGISVRFGNKAINTHIPRNVDFTSENCDKSFSMAKEFFSKYYSDYPTNFFMCHSWMLYSKNAEFMKKDSNILSFAKRFNIVNEMENPSQAYLWIFGKRESSSKLILHRKKYGTYGNTDNLKCETSLQKSLIEYIKNGGILGDTMGIYIP